ncbi:MAG: glycerophosphodiester phosphodiesterase [Proteobacteria bacterium]|nr:glycerophosphodiester phosphodiesterase [Pseudomonadota bacterium]
MNSNDTWLPEIVAHRGNAIEFPENTLQALESAVALGVRHVEFDVQLTADHVPVVFHDSDLARVGNRPESVHSLSWSQLAEIPVGEVSRLGERFAYTCAPSLAQAVEAIAGWDHVTAFVEVKRASLRRFGHEAVLRRVSDVLQPVLSRCVLISFDLAAVKILRQMTGARIGWVLNQYDADSLREATALAPEFLFCNLERVPAMTGQLWPGPWDWAIYEVRDLETARHCRELGAKYVETMAVRSLRTQYDEAASGA